MACTKNSTSVYPLDFDTCTMNAQKRENFVHKKLVIAYTNRYKRNIGFFLIKKVLFCNKVNNY